MYLRLDALGQEFGEVPDRRLLIPVKEGRGLPLSLEREEASALALGLFLLHDFVFQRSAIQGRGQAGGWVGFIQDGFFFFFLIFILY